MTCAFFFAGLATCIPGGTGGQASDGADRLVQVGDIRMNSRTCGSGPPLVMIMGYGNTLRLWEPSLIRSLSSSFRLILFDNRGVGSSEAGRRPFTIEQFADDTVGLMEALGIGQAHVLGWSMGALIAAEVALRHPDKVDRLVLYAGHCGADRFPPAPEIIGRLTDLSGSPREQGMRRISALFPPDWLQGNRQRVKELFDRPLGNIPPATVNRQSLAIASWAGCCDRLGRVRSPTLVVTGTDDVLVPPANAHLLAGEIPDARLASFEGGGHGLMFQYPETFGEQVRAFLKGSPLRATRDRP